jgi:hypothetical protein
MPEPLKIPISQLVINPENYRFEPVENQIEAIELMVSDQSEKLFNIAKSILEMGTNPNDWPMVVEYAHDTSQYLVLEGNRRITALKILNNVDLLDSNKFYSLKNKFKKLLKENTNFIPNTIWCSVYENPSEADVWIKLKHSGENDGVGTVSWGNHSVLRYQERVEGYSALPLQFIDFLKSSNSVDDELKINLKNIKSSTLDRILGDKDIKNALGIYTANGFIESDLKEEEITKGFVQVARDLLKPGFTVNDVYTKDDRKDYINKFPKGSLPDKTKKADSWKIATRKVNDELTNVNNKSANLPTKKVLPAVRENLIPKSFKISISNNKVNSIYHELRNPKLKLKEFPNSIAVTFRVFIELSVDCYIEYHNLISAPTSSGTSDNLQKKILTVTKDLYLKKIDDGNLSQGIIQAVKRNNHVLGIDSWHAYVHNNTLTPDADLLIKSWDNVEGFIALVWGAMPVR